MTLSKRLRSIAQLVTNGNVVADIGCDHGLLPIYLVQQGIIQKAYACDVKKGPLSRAKEAIDRESLTGIISTILTDGLHDLPEDVNSVVIAGMGFETIQKILEDGFQNLSDYHEIIVQPNTDVIDLRKWISQHHFSIMEDIVVHDGHFYHILKFNTKKGRTLTEDELVFGVKQEAEDFYDYCVFEQKKVKKILYQLNPQNSNYKLFTYYKDVVDKKIKEKMDH